MVAFHTILFSYSLLIFPEPPIIVLICKRTNTGVNESQPINLSDFATDSTYIFWGSF